MIGWRDRIKAPGMAAGAFVVARCGTGLAAPQHVICRDG